MNQKLRLGLLSLSIALLGTAAHAENPDQMRQLLSTGNCPGCDLSNASLSSLNLPNADLQGANLSGARFHDTQLTRANFTGANLSGASFASTNLTGANLSGADLSNVTSTFICNTDFFGYGQDIETCVSQILPLQFLPELCTEASEVMQTIASLSNNWTDVCRGENRDEALLFSAYTGGSFQLLNSSLSLRGANLSGANLKNADFAGADLSYATLTDTDAAGATFDYVRLMNADVTGLKNADISKAWVSWQALGEWLVAAQQRVQYLSQQEAGRLNIESIGYAQVASYVETGKFSQSLSSLNIGISPEDDAYRFGVVETGRLDMAYQYALSKAGDSPSFLSVVLLEANADGESVPSLHLCESEAVAAMAEPSRGIAPSNLPTIEASDGFFSCPAGWKLID